MAKKFSLTLALLCALCCGSLAFAQDTNTTGNTSGSNMSSDNMNSGSKHKKSKKHKGHKKGNTNANDNMGGTTTNNSNR